MVERCLTLIDDLKPRLWFVENPDTGLLKTRAVVAELPFVRVDYCMYGAPFGVRPHARSLTVRRTIHAVVNTNKRQLGNNRARLQQPGIGVFNKPQPGFQVINQIQTTLNQTIRPNQIPRGLCRGTRARILSTVGGGPNNVKVTRGYGHCHVMRSTTCVGLCRGHQLTATTSQPACAKGLLTLPVPEQRFKNRISKTSEK